MHLWKRSDNYMGEDYSEYFVLYSQTRDSNILDQSNFATILKHIGGESETVKVIRFSHWACGWVEAIMIHQSDKDMVALGESVERSLDVYCVFDESDYSQREWDAMVEYWRHLDAKYRMRDHGATAKQARRSFSWIQRNAENVYESVRSTVTE